MRQLVIIGSLLGTLALGGCGGQYVTFVRCPAPLDMPGDIRQSIEKGDDAYNKLWLKGYDIQQDILQDCFNANLVTG